MFTMNNTDGFSQTDLDTMNEVLEELAEELDGMEPYSISDAINNAWLIDGDNSAAALKARTLARLR